MTASPGICPESLPDSRSDESSRIIVVPAAHTKSWDPQQFAEEQIRGLVRQVFVTAGTQQTRQVVFSAADRETDISPICRRVGETLAAESRGRVCLLEANLPQCKPEKSFGRTSNHGDDVSERAGTARESSHHAFTDISLGLSDSAGSYGHTENLVSLQTRLATLRREFDYTIIQAESAGSATTAALFAHFVDGLVLVVAANRTKRLTVRKIREQLRANHVRMLGIVLSERSFPIPESLYRRL